MSTSVQLPASTDSATDQSARSRSTSRRDWVHELVIVLGFYYVYQTIRALADHGGVSSRAFKNATRLIDIEKTLHIFGEQAMQRAFIDARWFIKAINVYYGTLHFAITAGLLVWLFAKRRAAYRRLRNLLGLTTALALIGYWAFPLAPPRMLACNDSVPVPGPKNPIGQCFVDTLDTIGGLWSYHSPVAKAVANPFAAMPSLHFGWALWCGIVLYQFAKHRWVRWLGLAYPLLTLFAIVVTANHYFLDALGGAAILGAAIMIMRWRDRRRSVLVADQPTVAA